MDNLSIEVIPGNRLTGDERQAVIGLCSRAYEVDYEPFLADFTDPVHVLARLDGKLVSHALWITRWLQIGDQPPLRTAYVEAVATDEDHRGSGFATAVMERLAREIEDYDIGGLSPAETTLYARLGWETWQGPLFARTTEGLVPEPEEEAMILRLPNTPEIDLQAPASIEWREGEVW